jgi:hypothetical protein
MLAAATHNYVDGLSAAELRYVTALRYWISAQDSISPVK